VKLNYQLKYKKPTCSKNNILK